MEKGVLIAIVTTKANMDKVHGGNASLFIADDEEEMEKISLLMSRIFKSMVHDLGNGIYLLYRQ